VRPLRPRGPIRRRPSPGPHQGALLRLRLRSRLPLPAGAEGVAALAARGQGPQGQTLTGEALAPSGRPCGQTSARGVRHLAHCLQQYLAHAVGFRVDTERVTLDSSPPGVAQKGSLVRLQRDCE
jgi:hypothetical protein